MIIVSTYGFMPVLGARVVRDPSRIAAEMISGSGFQGGAGSIILRNNAAASQPQPAKIGRPPLGRTSYPPAISDTFEFRGEAAPR